MVVLAAASTCSALRSKSNIYFSAHRLSCISGGDQKPSIRSACCLLRASHRRGFFQFVQMFLNSYITIPETFRAQEAVLCLLYPRCRSSECRTFSIVFNVKHVVMTWKGGTTTGTWKTKSMVRTLTNNHFSTREELQAHRERTGMTGWRFILENIEMSFMGASFLVRGLLHISDDDYNHFDILFFHSTFHVLQI